MSRRVVTDIANRARTQVPRLLAGIVARPREGEKDAAVAAKALLDTFAEWGFFDAVRGLPKSAALVIDAPFYPVVASEAMFRTRASFHRLEKVVANPMVLAGRSDILILSADPHRDIERLISNATPGARVRSVINTWLPELMARKGFFGAGVGRSGSDEVSYSPDLRYIVFAPPRSGSYYLCELLFRAGYGLPREHLRPSTVRLFADVPGFRPTEFADRLVRETCRNGHFGTKVILHYLTEAATRRPSRLRLLRGWIERFDVKLIYLERRDVAAQAVSAVVAHRQNSWRLVDPAAVQALRPPRYDYDAIHTQYRHIKNQCRKAAVFLDSFPSVHRLHYEDLDERPLAVFNDVLNFLGGPIVDKLPPVDTLKVRNDAISAFADRFRKELAERGEA